MGTISQTINQPSSHSSSSVVRSKSDNSMIITTKHKIKKPEEHTLLSNSGSFKKNKPNDDSPKVSFLNNAQFIRLGSPYISEEEKLRNEFKKNKEKWLIKEDFKKCFGPTARIKPLDNYVQKTPSNPPVNYKFRDIRKSKWIAGHDFYIV